MKKGKFITFEGIEGCGKSTQIEFIKTYLESKKINVVTTREPGGTSLGESVRSVMLDNNLEICPNSELLLVLASRAQHLKDVITPNLKKGNWILCDRFNDSTLAYQVGGRGMDKKIVKDWITRINFEIEPTLTFYLDISAKTSEKRLASRNKLDRIENIYKNKMENIRSHFIEICKTDNNRCIVVDGEQSQDLVFKNIKSIIDGMF